MLKWLGYSKSEVLEFNNKRLTGLWFCIIGFVVITATLLGGDLIMNPFIFVIGYIVGFAISFSKKMQAKLSYGAESPFQKKIGNLAVVIMIVIVSIFGALFIPSMNFRMMWLGGLLAAGLHLLLFYFVHGKSMIYMAVILSINAILGMIFNETPFVVFGIVDGIIKVSFGVCLLFFSKPTTNQTV